jgi:hypothetical protein
VALEQVPTLSPPVQKDTKPQHRRVIMGSRKVPLNQVATEHTIGRRDSGPGSLGICITLRLVMIFLIGFLGPSSSVIFEHRPRNHW